MDVQFASTAWLDRLNVRGRVFGMPLRCVFLGLASLGMSSCVTSDTSLVAGATPTFGPQFTAQIFRDFVDGRARYVRASTYRWEDGAYVAVDGAPDLRRFVSVPMSGDLQLIQGSDLGRRIFTYWLARRIADGTYLIRPLDEGDVDVGSRKTLCARQAPGGLCFASTREHLLALAEATARSPVKDAEIAVIVGDGLKPTPDFIDVRR